MIVAIASEGDSTDSLVSAKGGRAPHYLLFEDGRNVKSIRNPFQSGGGAGFAVASMLSDERTELVIGQHFGEKMTGALADRHVRWMTVVSMTVGEALRTMAGAATEKR